VRRAICAGLLGGASLLFEYPLGLAVAALLVYVAFVRGPRRGLAFAAGTSLPVAALLLYNQWAFGSFLHFSYRYALPLRTDSSGRVIGENDVGFFGIGRPSGQAFVELLLSPRGLVTLTPICILGAVGIAMHFRRNRAEAALLASIVVLFLTYNTGYTLNAAGPFGGDSPGPRFLIAMLPFLLVPLGLAARAAPGATAALLTVSIAAMALVTSTTPMLGGEETGRWMRELRSGTFVDTVVTPLTATDLVAILPFAAGIGTLLAVGLHDVLRRAATQPAYAAFEAATAGIAWLLTLQASHHYREGSRTAAILAIVIAVLMGAATLLAAREAALRTPPPG
jgi:hypothetical protein